MILPARELCVSSLKSRKLGILEHKDHLSIWEAEAEGSPGVQAQPGPTTASNKEKKILHFSTPSLLGHCKVLSMSCWTMAMAPRLSTVIPQLPA